MPARHHTPRAQFLRRAPPAAATLTLPRLSSSQLCTDELIGAGAKVDAKDSQEGFTALLMAAAMGHLPVVRRLLRASADAEAANNDGATALMLATYAHKESVVRALLQHGAREGLPLALQFAERSGMTALAGDLRDAMPPAPGSIGWLLSFVWGWADNSTAASAANAAPSQARAMPPAAAAAGAPPPAPAAVAHAPSPRHHRPSPASTPLPPPPPPQPLPSPHLLRLAQQMDLGYLPLAMAMVFVGFFLLAFHLDTGAPPARPTPRLRARPGSRTHLRLPFPLPPRPPSPPPHRPPPPPPPQSRCPPSAAVATTWATASAAATTSAATWAGSADPTLRPGSTRAGRYGIRWR